jgi:hypothetical protein
MAIDYVIDLNCVPKETLTTDGIIQRLKEEERAQTIIALFRKNGDERPPSEMGFEFTRSTPSGEEEHRVIVVQELLDHAAELKPLAHHCAGCPANRAGSPFGCIGFIQYPVSTEAEAWMLDRLPVPDEPLVWLLLKQGVEEFKYDGTLVEPLRQMNNVYFADSKVQGRLLGEFPLNANQLFEMLFAVGHINPNHGALLLLFLHGIRRDLEANEIMSLGAIAEDFETRYPFLIHPEADDDTTVGEIKEFLRALYIAWKLNVKVLVDA